MGWPAFKEPSFYPYGLPFQQLHWPWWMMSHCAPATDRLNGSCGVAQPLASLLEHRRLPSTEADPLVHFILLRLAVGSPVSHQLWFFNIIFHLRTFRLLFFNQFARRPLPLSLGCPAFYFYRHKQAEVPDISPFFLHLCTDEKTDRRTKANSTFQLFSTHTLVKSVTANSPFL